VTKDEVRAVALFKQGCANDAEPGCFDLGLMYEKGVGAPVDRTKAVELYRKSCKAEDPWGCAQLRRLGVR
jgi:TPR repeat protein